MISIEPVLTNFGNALLTRALSGETITFTKMALGSGEISSSTDPTEMTELISPKLDIPITDIDRSDAGYVLITGEFDSGDISSDFYGRETGVFACGETFQAFSGTNVAKTFTLTDRPPHIHSVKVSGSAAIVSSYDANTGIVTLTTAPAAGTNNVVVTYPDTANARMFSYCNDGDSAGKLKANATSTVVEQKISVVIPVGENSNVTVVLPNNRGYATQADFLAHTSAGNPHGITKFTIGLGNVPNVSTNNQKPTYAVPDTLTEMSSGETMSSAFGKVARLIKNFISHLSAYNPHGISLATLNAAAASHNHNTSDISSGILSPARGGTGKGSISSFASELFSTSAFKSNVNNALTHKGIIQALGFFPTQGVLSVWDDISFCSVYITETGDVDECYNYTGEYYCMDILNNEVEVVFEGDAWGHEYELQVLGAYITNGTVHIVNSTNPDYLDDIDTAVIINLGRGYDGYYQVK